MRRAFHPPSSVRGCVHGLSPLNDASWLCLDGGRERRPEELASASVGAERCACNVGVYAGPEPGYGDGEAKSGTGDDGLS